MRLLAGLIVVGTGLLAAPAASAGEKLLTADEAVRRSCAAELHPTGTPGTVAREWPTVPARPTW